MPPLPETPPLPASVAPLPALPPLTPEPALPEAPPVAFVPPVGLPPVFGSLFVGVSPLQPKSKQAKPRPSGVLVTKKSLPRIDVILHWSVAFPQSLRSRYEHLWNSAS
jgi:hypothetical protein